MTLSLALRACVGSSGKSQIGVDLRPATRGLVTDLDTADEAVKGEAVVEVTAIGAEVGVAAAAETLALDTVGQRCRRQRVEPARDVVARRHPQMTARTLPGDAQLHFQDRHGSAGVDLG